MLAPIVFFAYNRPTHTEKVLNALAANPEAQSSILYVYCDGAKINASANDLKNISIVRKIVSEEIRFKQVRIHISKINKGLARSIIEGVSEIINKHGNVIVLEDDILVSPNFLRFMNDSLEIYRDVRNVGMIHSHIYDIEDMPNFFFMYKAGCWGWGTWAYVWNKINFNGLELYNQVKSKKLETKFNVNNSYDYSGMLLEQTKGLNQSWAVRLYAFFLLNGYLTFYPGQSLSEHIGYDGGTHYEPGRYSKMDGKIVNGKRDVPKLNVENNEFAIKKLERFYKSFNMPISNNTSIIRRLINKVKCLVK